MTGHDSPVQTKTVGENLALGDPVYQKSDGKMWKADADAAATMPCVAIALETILADADGEFLFHGSVIDGTWMWTVGANLYIDITASGLTETAPSGTGDQVQLVAVALSATEILFNPSLVLVEIL